MISIIRANHTASNDKHITVTIHHDHEEYILLTIEPVHLENPTKPYVIGNNSFNSYLLECHYY